MGADSLLTEGTLSGFLFMLARISGVFAFLPIAAFRATPDAPKIVLSLATTLMLRSQWKVPASGMTMGGMVSGLAGEAALGIAIGVSLAIVFEVFQMAAQAVSTTAGFGYASTIDPTSGADSTVLLTTAQLTAGLLFFASGADRLLVKALSESVRLAPPASFKADRTAALALIRFGATIFAAGLRLAAPVTALLLLADAALAVLGRVQAQLHLISLTMPVKLAATMLVLSATAALQPGFFESLMTTWVRVVEGILRSGH
jgi:flagellar biosynthetic protein FliR